MSKKKKPSLKPFERCSTGRREMNAEGSKEIREVSKTKEIHKFRGLNKEEEQEEEEGRWRVRRTEAETGMQGRTMERDNRKRKNTIITIWEGEKHLKILTKELRNGGGAGRDHRKMRVCYKSYPCVGWEP